MNLMLWRHGICLLVMFGIVVACLLVGFLYASRTEILPYLQRQCEILEVVLENSTTTEGDVMWRCVFTVSGTTKQLCMNEPCPAYRNDTQAYVWTREEALECEDTEKFPQSPDATTCYIPQQRNMTYVISMTEAYQEHEVATWYLYTSLTMAAVTGFAVCLYLMHVNRTFLNRARTDETTEQATTAHPAPTRKTEGFSKEQVRQIVHAYYTSEEDPHEDQCCAICLDELGGKFCHLPCEHDFHYMCLKQWLRRGGVKCPLCNANVPAPNDPAAEEAEQPEQPEQAV